MSLRKTLPALAVLGGLSALGSPSAFALAPGQAIAARVYVGGATAQDPGFLLIARSICQNNAIDTGNLAASDANRMDAYLGTDNQVYTCLSNAELAPTVPTGTAIAIYKTSIGGSGTGVIPVARQVTTYGSPTPVVVRFLPTTLTSMPNSGNCTLGAVTASVTVGTRTAAQFLTHTACGAGSFDKVPEVGISDVEPALIDGALPTDVSALTTTAVNHSVFTWSVSEPLRNALQAAQGLVPCTVARGDASRELVANQPSLTKDQIASILTGLVDNWNQITAKNSTLGLYDYIAANGGAGCLLPSSVGNARTFIIRRVPSSGTQAISEIWTLRQRCAAGILPILEDSDPANDSANTAPSFNTGLYVQAYSSSSGVRNGLDRAAGPWSVVNPAATEAYWAIGNLSCENTPINSSAGNRSYRAVRINGAFPGLLDTANSLYSFYAEQVVNTSNAAPPPAGLPAAFASYLATNLADPDVLKLVNAGFVHPGNHATDQGQGCLMGVPDFGGFTPPAAPITAAAIANKPVNTSNKRPLGFTNNCQDPIILGVGDSRTPAGGSN